MLSIVSFKSIAMSNLTDDKWVAITSKERQRSPYKRENFRSSIENCKSSATVKQNRRTTPKNEPNVRLSLLGLRLPRSDGERSDHKHIGWHRQRVTGASAIFGPSDERRFLSRSSAERFDKSARSTPNLSPPIIVFLELLSVLVYSKMGMTRNTLAA